MLIKWIIVLVTFRDAWCEKKVGDSCVEEYTNSLGVCIPSEHCESAKIALQNNGVRPTFCLYSFDDPLVCCKDTGTYVPSTATTVRTEPPSPAILISNSDAPLISSTSVNADEDETSIVKERVSERKCVEYSQYGAPRSTLEPVPNELIVGGVPTELHEFPHMAAIGWLNYEDTYSFNCGGSLISPTFVLTAGHCTSDPTARVRAPSLVRLGDQNIDPDENDGANPEEIPIKTIIRHPSYAPPLRYDDIALIELASPAELSGSIRPACLWDKGEITHQSAVAIGWGVSDVKTRTSSKELQKVSLTLQDSAYCDRLLYVNRNRNWDGFAPAQLCAGELRPGKDTCQGDSGAPLQVKSNNVYRIVGITSFGLNNCAASGRPAVYTRVSSYVPWIESVVWPGE